MKGAKAFSDMSTAPADEKVRRFLEALTDREHPKYFHDDGFPRRFLAEDAEAALFWFNFILAENKRQCAVLKMVQEALGSNVEVSGAGTASAGLPG